MSKSKAPMGAILVMLSVVITTYVAAESGDIHENAKWAASKDALIGVAESTAKYSTAGAVMGLATGAPAVGAKTGAIGGAVKGLWEELKNFPGNYDDAVNRQLIGPGGPLEGGCIRQHDKQWGNC